MDLLTGNQGPGGRLASATSARTEARHGQRSAAQERRLAALERVVTAPPVEAADLRREMVATAMLIVGGLASVALLLAAVLGALWLLT